MSVWRNPITVSLALGVALLVLSGCGIPAYRAHPNLKGFTPKIRTVGLAPPDIKIYSLSAGGVKELRDDWSDQGRESVIQALKTYFEKRDVKVKVINVGKKSKREMEDLQAVYRAVSSSILDHTYSQTDRFPEKMKNFDYSVGSIDGILKPYGANALIVVYAVDEISTGGRKILKAVTSPLSMLTGIRPRSGFTAMSVALINDAGEVLWYNIEGAEGTFDLREKSKTSILVNQILGDFPRLTP